MTNEEARKRDAMLLAELLLDIYLEQKDKDEASNDS